MCAERDGVAGVRGHRTMNFQSFKKIRQHLHYIRDYPQFSYLQILIITQILQNQLYTT
jgi:hypothetical protein